MVCLLTGPLFAVVFPKGQFWGLSNKLSKLADDTKLGINTGICEGSKKGPCKVTAIGEWYTVWQMPFNLNKCHVLHVGTDNQGENNYSLLGSTISSVHEERDLGVAITADLTQRPRSMYSCRAKGTKDPGLYKAGVPLPQGTGKDVAGVRCTVLVPN